MQVTSDTRLIDMTVGDLMQLITETINSQRESQTPNYFKGMTGIAAIFNCSIRTACRIKKSGKINQAISQSGRTFIVDADKARKLLTIND